MGIGKSGQDTAEEGGGGSQPPRSCPKTFAVGQTHDNSGIFHAAVEMSLVPIVLADPHQNDHPIVFANAAFSELTGYHNAEILGHNCRFLQGPSTDPAAVGRIRKAIASRWHVHEELVNYRKDGTAFWNALFINPVFDQAGHLAFFFGMQLDVTRRRRAEEVLKGLQSLFSDLKSNIEQGLDKESGERQRQFLQNAAAIIQEADVLLAGSR